MVGLLPVVVKTYGFNDDYPILATYTRGSSAIFDGAIAQGRPLAAVLQKAGFLLVDDVPSLRWFRLLSVLCYALSALVLVRALQRWEWSAPAAWLAGVGALLVPSTSIMTGWAILVMGPVSVLLGTTAAVHLPPALGRRGPRAAPGALLGSTALLTAAVLFYQPGAMVFWSVVLAWFLSPNCRDYTVRDYARASVVAGAVGFVAAAAGFIAVKVGGAAVGGQSSRSALLTDPLDKVSFLVKAIYPNAFYPWEISVDRQLGFLAAVLTLAALWWAVGGRTSRRITLLVLAGLALTLGWLANLPLAENTQTARSLTGVFAVPPLLWAAVLDVRSRDWQSPVVTAGRWVLVGAATALGLAFTLHTLDTYLTGPSSTEYARAKAAFEQTAGAGQPVLAVPSLCTQTSAPRTIADEFGLPSTCLGWVVNDFSSLMFREVTGSWPTSDQLALVDPVAVPAGSTVVDYGRLLVPRSGPVVHD